MFFISFDFFNVIIRLKIIKTIPMKLTKNRNMLIKLIKTAKLPEVIKFVTISIVQMCEHLWRYIFAVNFKHNITFTIVATFFLVLKLFETVNCVKILTESFQKWQVQPGAARGGTARHDGILRLNFMKVEITWLVVVFLFFFCWLLRRKFGCIGWRLGEGK